MRFGLDTLTLHTNEFHASINPDWVRIPGVRTWRFNGRLFLSFSVAGFGRTRNLKVVSARELKRVLIRIESLVKKQGVFFNIADTHVSRMDLFVDRRIGDYQAFIDKASKVYIPYLNAIRYFATTLYRGSKSREICIYNKTEEMRAKGKGDLCKPKFSNMPLVRLEWRFLKARVVKKKLLIDTAQSLVKQWPALSKQFSYNHVAFSLLSSLGLLKNPSVKGFSSFCVFLYTMAKTRINDVFKRLFLRGPPLTT